MRSHSQVMKYLGFLHQIMCWYVHTYRQVYVFWYVVY